MGLEIIAHAIPGDGSCQYNAIRYILSQFDDGINVPENKFRYMIGQAAENASANEIVSLRSHLGDVYPEQKELIEKATNDDIKRLANYYYTKQNSWGDEFSLRKMSELVIGYRWNVGYVVLDPNYKYHSDTITNQTNVVAFLKYDSRHYDVYGFRDTKTGKEKWTFKLLHDRPITWKILKCLVPEQRYKQIAQGV